MAFADHFNKNLQSAGALMKGMQPDAFKAVLEKEVVGIGFDEQAAKSPEGSAILDLFVRLMARLYPSMVLANTDGKAGRAVVELAELAAAVNPSIDLTYEQRAVTKWVVVGRTRVQAGAGAFVVYAGSDKWLAKISTAAPMTCGRTKNPFGAGAAACFAAANVFRATFAEQLGNPKPDEFLVFSLLDFAVAKGKYSNPSLKTIHLGDFHLVGLGAIGNGFLWALARLSCTGNIHLVDGDVLEVGNLQRYAMTVRNELGKKKIQLAEAWVKDCGATLHTHPVTWEEYVASRTDLHFDRVAVAVDTERSRINIQATLPKTIFNAWTAAGTLGVSWHRFEGDNACLACLYMPDKPAPNFDEVLARALHLPEDQTTLLEIRQRLELNQPTDQPFLEKVSSASGVALDELLPFVGISLREFYVKAICGGAVMAFGSAALRAQADVPMAFQSALAGLFLAADVAAHCNAVRPHREAVTQLDLLRAVPPVLALPRGKHARCICADADFLAAYRAKYGGGTASPRQVFDAPPDR